MILKNRNIISKIKRSKVTDYAALSDMSKLLDESGWEPDVIGQNLQPHTEYHSAAATAHKRFKTLKLLKSNNLDNKINSQATHLLLA